MTADPFVELPWPDRALHPNARGHWAKKAKATKAARAAAAWAATAAGMRKLTTEAVSVNAIFVPPDNRRRDLDGMLTSIKPALDGIADILGIDDSKWSLAMRKEAPEAPGLVRIEISIVEKPEA